MHATVSAVHFSTVSPPTGNLNLHRLDAPQPSYASSLYTCLALGALLILATDM